MTKKSEREKPKQQYIERPARVKVRKTERVSGEKYSNNKTEEIEIKRGRKRKGLEEKRVCVRVEKHSQRG